MSKYSTTDILMMIAISLFIAIMLMFLPQGKSQPVKAEVAAQCPADTDKGVYFERGRDDSGNPICGFAWFNACPYTEAVPADDPLCYKNQPQVEYTIQSVETTEPTNTCKSE